MASLTEEMMNQIEETSLVLEIKGIHYFFWKAFIDHSINAIQDSFVHKGENYEISLELFKNLESHITENLDEFYDKAQSGEMYNLQYLRTELSFLEVVILHDQLEMFCDTLLLSKNEVMHCIGKVYLFLLKNVLKERETLYRLTVRYLMNDERGTK